MTRKRNTLDGWAALLDGTAEGDLIDLFGREARLRRSAEALASDELAEGAWVDEAEPATERVRLAAQDADESVTFADAQVRVRAEWDGGTLVLVQELGPAGVTAMVGGTPVPLHPGRPASVSVDAVPTELVLLDHRGRRRVLRPVT